MKIDQFGAQENPNVATAILAATLTAQAAVPIVYLAGKSGSRGKG
jgi:hypothetical protein